MNELQQIIRHEIDAHGPLTCARFMALALYHPNHGYYEKRINQVGREGDFQTSVSVGPLFGELLAWRFATWLEPLASAGIPIQIVEAGAHQGQLALDILGWLKIHRPQLMAGLRYGILEPSARRRQHQTDFLAAVSDHVDWFPDMEALRPATGNVRGVIFSNELLDAFPIHRFGWSARENNWTEFGIGVRADQFHWMPLPTPVAPRPPQPAPELAAVLPDGFTVETMPAAVDWWGQAAGILEQGWLVALDYGLEAGEFFDPSRARGTLRGYRNHAPADNVLADPGEQDLTAHVNWTPIRETGEAAGLLTKTLTPQGTFLTALLRDAVTDPAFANLSPKQIRQFQTLTHPQHFGRRFQALVQSRVTAPSAL